MRIGWLHDPVKYVGGAELSGREFRAAAPEGVEVVDCPPGGIETGLDTYVAHNVTRYAPEEGYDCGEDHDGEFFVDIDI